MKHNLFSVVAAGALLLAAAPGAYAQATTTAGLKVENNASVKYTVNSVEQTQPVLGDVTFTVDRKVVLSVTERDIDVTSVSPEATNKTLAFTVTNGSNDFLDIALAASDAVVGTIFKGGDGSLSETSTKVTGATFTLYFDDGTTELPKSGGVYYLDGLRPGGSVDVLVVADAIPDAATVANDDVMVVQLVGTAHSAYLDQRVPTAGVGGEIELRDAQLVASADYANSALGAILADNASASDDADEIDNVFADVADTTEGTGDGAGDGHDTSYDAYKVSSTTINVTKTYGVISDGLVPPSANPKPIPGAELLYCITVSNGGTVNATDVTITDSIPDGTTYTPGSLKIEPSDVAAACSTDPGTTYGAVTAVAKTDAVDADEGQFAGSTVTTKVNVNAGDDTTTMFKVTVNAF